MDKVVSVHQLVSDAIILTKPSAPKSESE